MALLALLAQAGLHRGFLPTRGTWLLDLFFLTMFLVLAGLAASLLLVRYGRYFQWHRRIQLLLTAILLIAVASFEIEIRWLAGDWRPLAETSPFYASGLVHWMLGIHLCFAIPTPVVWTYVLVRALREFPNPPVPGVHSRAHMLWARLAAAGMLGTVLTGCAFYWLAFAA